MIVDLDWPQLKRGAYRQRSAIWALVFKEFKIRLGKSRIGLFWTLVQPMTSMVMMAFIRLASGTTEIHQIDVVLFIGMGFVIFNAFRPGINFIPQSISSNQGLLNYPQVKPIDTIIARFILSCWLHLLASILLVFVVWWILGDYPEFPDPLLCVTTLIIAFLFGLGVSLPLTIFGTINESVLKFVNIVSMPLMILSGVMFSMNEMPQTVRQLLAYNPLVHLIEGFRHGAFGVRLFPEYNLAYPVFVTIGLLGIGFALYFIYRFRLLMK
ncbi:ABC transporter permease [uncultured Cohaesibacter sp.]|uniref:ABC transporter permease n=1 Tax=uncultured Cohaesibacter sp. TaxID=1002546 RepID=UPI0029C8C62D|nr:ABC transporter permease [uncultured Cohaesibacter sp.]